MNFAEGFTKSVGSLFEKIGTSAYNMLDPISRQSQLLKEEGNALYQQKRYTEAIDKYSKAISLNPTESSYYFNRSLCYSCIGKWQLSLDDAKKCISLNDHYMKAYYRTAIVLQTLNEYDDALKVVTNGLQIFPDNVDLKRMDEKLQLHITVSKLKADGDSKFAMDDFEGAITLYSKCIEKISSDEEISEIGLKCYSNRSLCFMHIGDHQSTIWDCSKVLHHRPLDIKARIRRSQALEAVGRLADAIADVDAVLSQGPDTIGRRAFALAEELLRRLRRLDEEARNPALALLRKASVDDCGAAVCFCMEPMVPGFNTVRLRCKCVLHEHCIVSYIRSKLGDRSSVTDRGVSCPYNCSGFVWIDDVDALCRMTLRSPISGLHGTGVSPLTEDEAAKFRLWVISASFDNDELVACPLCATPHWVDRAEESGVTMVRCSNTNCRIRFCCACQVAWHSGISCEDYQKRRGQLDDSSALLAATSKFCPNCHTAVTHYHGHACHHIRGCPGCGAHFCYRCLSTEEENERLRGERSRCLCEEGRWGTFCSDDDILDHLELSPFPHDRRCGCPICPDCRKGHQCAGCNGDCVVCKGIAQPGPVELQTYDESQTKVYYSGCFKELGNSLYNEGEYADAIRKFSKAIELNPNDVTYFSNRSACYAAMGLWEEAAADGYECVRVSPSFTKGYLRTSVALLNLGRLGEGLQVVDMGLQHDPRCIQLLRTRSELESKLTSAATSTKGFNSEGSPSDGVAVAMTEAAVVMAAAHVDAIGSHPR